MKNNKLILRSSTFLFGLFIMAMGVALSVKANLGVSPISCIPYVYSFLFPYTLGELTIAFNILIILLQILLLRRRYRLIQLIQLPVVFAFGYFIDLSMNLLNNWQLTNYIGQMLVCLLSCAVLALGVYLEVKAKITYLPGEGLALAISETFKKEFGKSKVGVDSGMVILGIISSYIFLHQLQGIREGTIIAAIIVGFIAKFYSQKIDFLFSWLEIDTPEETANSEKDKITDSNLIINISREYGSGGHEIGKYIAKELGLAFYDKKLIELTAEKSGFSTNYIKKNEQKLAHSLLFELYEQNYAYINEKQPPLDALFLVQSKIIREISAKAPCVIVGRCANFILKENKNCFNVFIHADNEYRKKKIAEEYNIKTKITDKELEKTDKQRDNYCSFYTNKNWHDALNYHLTIDSSRYGTKATAKMIIKAVERFREDRD